MNFQDIKSIPELLTQVVLLLEETRETNRILKRKFKEKLESKKDVAEFLGVTPRTINNYIKEGKLKEGYHFNRKNDKLLVFTEVAILEFRDNLTKGIA